MQFLQLMYQRVITCNASQYSFSSGDRRLVAVNAKSSVHSQDPPLYQYDVT